MLKFKRDILQWRDRILRAAYLTGLQVEDLPGCEFRLTAEWKDGKYSLVFTRGYVMGHTASKPKEMQRPLHKPCWYRDEFIRQVLTARGV